MRYYVGQGPGRTPLEAGARRRNGGRSHAQGAIVRTGKSSRTGSGGALRKYHRMTEFRRAERRRQLQRKVIKILTVAGFTMLAAAKAYSFVSEGASRQDYIQVPPLTEVLESAEAPGSIDETAESAALVELPETEVAKAPLPESRADMEEMVNLGEFEMTGYCGCDICCGTKAVKLTKMETVPKPEYTVAADPEVIPLGSSIVINGVTYHVEDVGQAIKGKSIDIFFATHEEAIEFGRQKMTVYLKQSL